MDEVQTLQSKPNGTNGAARSIPMPSESLSQAVRKKTTPSTTMPRKVEEQEKAFIEKYGGILLTVVIMLIPNIGGYYVMSYRIDSLEKKHEKEMDAEKTARISDISAVNQRASDAQAYGNAALNQSKFVQGILLGKGVLSANEINQIQTQQAK